MKQDFTRNTNHRCSIASQAHMPGHVLDCRRRLTKDSVGEAKWSARNSHTWPKQPHPPHVPAPSQWSLKKSQRASQSIFEGLIQKFHEDLFVFHLLCKASFIPLHPFCTLRISAFRLTRLNTPPLPFALSPPNQDFTESIAIEIEPRLSHKLNSLLTRLCNWCKT